MALLNLKRNFLIEQCTPSRVPRRSRTVVPKLEIHFMKDNFSCRGGSGGKANGSGSNANDGEQQMKLQSFASCLLPAVWPSF